MIKKYENKYFSILGDSISTLAGCSQPREAAYYDGDTRLFSHVRTSMDTWWGRVIDALGGKLLVNNSWSGSLVCKHPLCEIPSYACSDERTSALDKDGVSPDVILVYMGTNDWGHGVRVLQEGTEVAEPCSIFSAAYTTMLKKLQRNYPNAEIWCFTMPITRCSAKENFTFPYYFGGRHIEEYCKAITACAQAMGCRVVDLYNRTEQPDTMEGFHPTAEGMKTIADAVLALINE